MPAAIVARVGRPALNRSQRAITATITSPAARSHTPRPAHRPARAAHRALPWDARTAQYSMALRRNMNRASLSAACSRNSSSPPRAMIAAGASPSPRGPPQRRTARKKSAAAHSPRTCCTIVTRIRWAEIPCSTRRNIEYPTVLIGSAPKRGKGVLEVDPAVGESGQRRSPDEQEPDPQQQSDAEQRRQRKGHAIARDREPRAVGCGQARPPGDTETERAAERERARRPA